ncbi:uncharacterized protein LOC134443419 [Engraulis encrasicolus]|uniref:uncharacterized protein LOC134443419 n=1 Tax=Engraulis encrasicolus TaxID=184585 RepID=UPI002FD5BCEF
MYEDKDRPDVYSHVLMAELCALSLGNSTGHTNQDTLSNQVQSHLESINQLAQSTSDSLLLCQSLYLSLLLPPTHTHSHGESPSDAVLLARHWAGQDPAEEGFLLVNFLSIFLTSLRSTALKASVPITTTTTRMELRCLELLLDTLEEAQARPSKALIRLAESRRWTPVEAMGLLRALVDTYTEDDAAITEVLTLVRVYDVPPLWTDESAHPLAESLCNLGANSFLPAFQATLKRRDERSLESVLHKWKASASALGAGLDDSTVYMVKSAVTSVLQGCKNVQKEAAAFTRNTFRVGSLGAEDLQRCLSELCKAVHVTKGWYPTATQMVSWCSAMLEQQKKGVLETVIMDEDPCVVAMVAVTLACMGHKVNVVTSSRSRQEWAALYKHVGVSLSTDQRQSYEADVVYGSLEDFMADYFLLGTDGDTRSLRRAFIVEERSVSSVSQSTEPSRVEVNTTLKFAIEHLQSLMTSFQGMKLRHKFFKMFCQMLVRNLETGTDTAILTVLKKLSGKSLPPTEARILTFFENLMLKVFTGEEKGDSCGTSMVGEAYLEIMFRCAMQFQASEDQPKDVFQSALTLVSAKCVSPIEALDLLSTLTDKCQGVAIMKVLHLMETYQISSDWRDGNGQSLLVLLKTLDTESHFIQHLESSFKEEKIKSLYHLSTEICHMRNIDKQTLESACEVVRTVRALIDSGDITKHTDVQLAHDLSKGTSTGDLVEVLAVLCNAIHKDVFQNKWWPKDTQMLSWCMLALADNGKLLEMPTGEGKSVVIAMFAALRALRGERVDVLSSSSVLCQRDAQDFAEFYKSLGLTVDKNTNKEKDEDRKQCYQKNVVYGTIGTFAADHLRQTFEMKDVRSDRGYQCVIVDEVDSLLLDEGVQMTYLSSPVVSMQHLNTLLAMIWTHVSQYGYLATENQTFVQGPPASFFKAIFDAIDTDNEEIEDAMDVLGIAESCGIVPQGFTEDIYKSDKDEILQKVRTVSQEKVLEFFQCMEQYVPYDFVLYTLGEDGMLSLRVPRSYNDPNILELSFLVLEDGFCCPLYESSDALVGPIAQLISEKIQYEARENSKDKVSVPGFLRPLVKAKVSAWVQNAFLALTLQQGREYVLEDGAVCPVDYRSTGIIESNKRWGDGLQQFLEMKHQVKLSTISTVTNYLSNVAFFEKYKGKLYGTTGTLGTESDLLWLHDLYPTLTACRMPTFSRRKLFEVDGVVTASAAEWRAGIKRVVLEQISPNNYRGGRAALVICESINSAEEIQKELSGVVPGQIILYVRSDKDSLSNISRELQPGDVIVATNLAGRGTNIKVSDVVNDSGGLFVVLTFLPENNRVELQAFGRTARKGKPGSAQMVLNRAQLAGGYGSEMTMRDVKATRRRLAEERLTDMRYDVKEMRLREVLFAQYCNTLHSIYRDHSRSQEQFPSWGLVVPQGHMIKPQSKSTHEKDAVVAVLNENWGIWLQANSSDIDQLRAEKLEANLRDDLDKAGEDDLSQTPSCASIYHYIHFGNLAMADKKWDVSMRLFDKAMKKDADWAAVAFYNHAYCTIQKKPSDYMDTALKDLKKAQASLAYLSEDTLVCLQFIRMAAVTSSSSCSDLEKQLMNRCGVFSCFEKNITDAMAKIKEIKDAGREAEANETPMLSLVNSTNEDKKEEAWSLYSRGLKYVFSVEEKSTSFWEALGVFVLGLAQVLIGVGLCFIGWKKVGGFLIDSGLSDMYSGVKGMVTGEFSWKDWAIDKVFGIGMSFTSFLIGKLIDRRNRVANREQHSVDQGEPTVIGVQAFKEPVNRRKKIPKALSTTMKKELSDELKNNLKNDMKQALEKVLKDVAIGQGEQEAINKIVEEIRKEVKQAVINGVKSRLAGDPLSSLVDDVILSHLVDKSDLSQLLQDGKRKGKMVDICMSFGKSALQPFSKDLSWKNKLNSSITAVLEDEQGNSSGLKKIQAAHMSILCKEAITTAEGLSEKFFANFTKELDEFKREKSQGVKRGDLSSDQAAQLSQMKAVVADAMSELLADALVDVFHQKFSSHMVKYAQDEVHSHVMKAAEAGLKSERTQKALTTGQMKCTQVLQKAVGKLSHSHADKVLDSNSEGTLMDIRVLAEATSTRVVVLTEGEGGRLSRLGSMSPSSGAPNQTLTLIHRPDSGRYDVRINQNAVRVHGDCDGEATLHLAFARGLKPSAGPDEVRVTGCWQVRVEAERLRQLEADALRGGANRWEPLLRRQELILATRGHHESTAGSVMRSWSWPLATAVALTQGSSKPLQCHAWMTK